MGSEMAQGLSHNPANLSLSSRSRDGRKEPTPEIYPHISAQWNIQHTHTCAHQNKIKDEKEFSMLYLRLIRNSQ